MLKELATVNDLNNTVFPPALFALTALCFILAALFSPYGAKARFCLGLIGLAAGWICVILISKS